MISIASAMQQDAIKELLEGYNEDGVSYTFKKKTRDQIDFLLPQLTMQKQQLKSEKID